MADRRESRPALTFEDVQFHEMPSEARSLEACPLPFSFFELAYIRAQDFVDHELSQNREPEAIECTIENLGYAILHSDRRMRVRERNAQTQSVIDGKPLPQMTMSEQGDQDDQKARDQFMLQQLMFMQIYLHIKSGIEILPTSFLGDPNVFPDTPSNRYYFPDTDDGRKILDLFTSLPNPTTQPKRRLIYSRVSRKT